MTKLLLIAALLAGFLANPAIAQTKGRSQTRYWGDNTFPGKMNARSAAATYRISSPEVINRARPATRTSNAPWRIGASIAASLAPGPETFMLP